MPRTISSTASVTNPIQACGSPSQSISNPLVSDGG